MDTYELMYSASGGDMEKIKFLVERRDVDLNARDGWDATPLYYACLCGHEDVVQYLIEQGARCEADTFDGERCLYAALTPAIKQILKEANLINAKTMRRDSFEEFLRQLLESAAATDASSSADIKFLVHGETVNAHKCLLFARSEFFAGKLLDKWRRKSSVKLNNSRLSRTAFKAFVRYLYTGVMDVNVCEQEDFVRLLKQVGADELREQIQERVKKAENYKKLKPGKNFGQIITVQLPETGSKLANDLGKLAEAAMPRDDDNAGEKDDENEDSGSRQARWTDDAELPFMEERPPHAPFADVCFYVDGATFFCHKVFFCGRSDFFRALIDDHFQESDAIVRSPIDDSFGVRIPRKSLNSWSEEFGPTSPASSAPNENAGSFSPSATAPFQSGDSVFPTPPSSFNDAALSSLSSRHDAEIALLPLIRLHSVSRPVFERIVRYVYTNKCDLDAEIVYDVLEAADQFLLPGLKTICGLFIAECLEVENVMEVLRTARLFTLHRLEDSCYAFIAKNLEHLVHSAELKRVIAADAAEIENRDEERGDSIPIVDEIRYHLSANVQSWSEMEEAGERMALVHTLLEELSFDGCRQKELDEEEGVETRRRRALDEAELEEWDMEFMMEMPDDVDMD